MKNDDHQEVPPRDIELEERRRRRHTRWALIFGVVMATAQMGILLFFMYC